MVRAEPAPAPKPQNMNPAAATRAATLQKITIQHIRPLDQRGINGLLRLHRSERQHGI